MLDEDTEAWSDSYITYSGASTTTITGLSHLEGEEVAVMGDGAVQASKTVSGGQITIDTAVESAVVGLPYTAKFQTQKLEGGSAIGNSQGKRKRIHNVIMRLKDAGVGLYVGSKESNVTAVTLRTTTDDMDSPVPKFTGDKDHAMKGGNDDGGIIYGEHTLPQPCTIIAMWPQVEVSDDT